jgi:poly-gamma-glutamate synthesis protein (capsule biosynthesis protein)
MFLCGDAMTGRGVDQILPHPGDPALRESVVHDARSYVRLAERINGLIPSPVGFAWPWGEALSLLDEFDPDVRLINLETAITTGDEFAAHKAVHYRMHPDNVACLTAARPDACMLGNNHILDFGVQGLADTLRALTRVGVRTIGAGRDEDQAQRPAVVPLGDGGRAVIGGYGSRCSGIPPTWEAGHRQPGVAFIPDLSKRTATDVAERLLTLRRPGDITIVSIHWGSNWGYEVDPGQVEFAHRLIDMGIDVVHGHSSHHPRAVEVYRGKLILYGCGDMLDDYEGIRTFEAFRQELRLMYLASIDRDTGALAVLELVPLRMRKLRLERVAVEDAEWLRSTLEWASRPFGTRVGHKSNGLLMIQPA